MDIDLPDVLAEVEAAFARYEVALIANDVATLDAMFHDDARTIRYGDAENLYGFAAIAEYRARQRSGFERSLSHTVITSYGRAFAVASTLFKRTAVPGKLGRQMQTWVKFGDTWKVVAAHVSMIDPPTEGAM